MLAPRLVIREAFRDLHSDLIGVAVKEKKKVPLFSLGIFLPSKPYYKINHSNTNLRKALQKRYHLGHIPNLHSPFLKDVHEYFPEAIWLALIFPLPNQILFYILATACGLRSRMWRAVVDFLSSVLMRSLIAWLYSSTVHVVSPQKILIHYWWNLRALQIHGVFRKCGEKNDSITRTMSVNREDKSFDEDFQELKCRLEVCFCDTVLWFCLNNYC